MGKIAASSSFKSGIKSYLVAHYMHMDVSKSVLKLLLEVLYLPGSTVFRKTELIRGNYIVFAILSDFII